MTTPLEIVEDLEYLVMNDGGRSQIESFKYSRQTEDEEFAFADVEMGGECFVLTIKRVFVLNDKQKDEDFLNDVLPGW